jgi:hypothetical protein
MSLDLYKGLRTLFTRFRNLQIIPKLNLAQDYVDGSQKVETVIARTKKLPSKTPTNPKYPEGL